MGKDTQAKITLREFSAGGVVYQGKKFLVTKSSPSEKYPISFWRLPKGWIDNESEDTPGVVARGDRRATNEDLEKAALREVREEGGVDAKIVEKIGTINFSFHSTRGKVLKFVTYFLMKWTKDLPEGTDSETSEIAWLPFKEAYEKLSFQGEKEVLQKARDLLEG